MARRYALHGKGLTVRKTESHTTALRGGEQVGYQGRKKRKTTNALYLTDRQGLPIIMSSPKSGEHHDVHDIEAVMETMLNDLEKANVRIDGLFLNADAGFDCDMLCSILERKEIIPNICINRQSKDTIDSKRFYMLPNFSINLPSSE